MAYTGYPVLVRPVMESFTGLPADRYMNDFAFQLAAEPDEAGFIALTALVSEFYRDATTSLSAVGEFISNAVNRASTHEIQVYRIQAGDLGSPVYTTEWLGPPTSSQVDAVPTEVAGVLSFHADLDGILEESGVTRPRARRRGRVYIGPLNMTAIDESSPPYMLAGIFRQTLQEAAVRLMDDADTAGAPWSVWSRADQALRPVTGGWTDNAPDTQRRRGPAPTVRALWGS